ncbi:MAG: DUF5655 domain-containing protein [Dehalococcoidales bacterium]|nr:DUF5655 domain-containing protein [Dehalococcoidales bacterium]
MPLSPREMEAAVIKNLPAKTGKNLEQWVALAKAQAPPDKNARLEWLKNTYQLGQIQASIILSVMETGKSTYADANSLMKNLFAGENAGALPLYLQVRKLVASIGTDIKVSVNRTYVTFTRQQVFLTLKPVKGVLIAGLALPEDVENDRLTRARFLGTPHRINLQVSVRTLDEVDGDLKFLVKKSYDGS